MLEKIIVIGLIVAAVVGWVLYIWRETRQTPCDGCVDCKLRKQCKHIKK